jgi:hypothetical protein
MSKRGQGHGRILTGLAILLFGILILAWIQGGFNQRLLEVVKTCAPHAFVIILEVWLIWAACQFLAASEWFRACCLAGAAAIVLAFHYSLSLR